MERALGAANTPAARLRRVAELRAGAVRHVPETAADRGMRAHALRASAHAVDSRIVVADARVPAAGASVTFEFRRGPACRARYRPEGGVTACGCLARCP